MARDTVRGPRNRWILAAAAVLAITFPFAVWRLWSPGRAFDPVAWQDKSQVREGVRLGMADRLMARRMLRGKTQAEVVQLLGEPEQTGYFRDWDMVYRLGPERGFLSVDSEWLVVRFGADGRVAEYRLARD